MLGRLGTRGLLLCLALVGIFNVSWVMDNDIWFILNCGRYVIENGIPYEEFASMHKGLHYVMEQWLTAVIFWKVYESFAANGILTLTWILGIVIICFYFRLCFIVSEGNTQISIAMTALVGIIVSIFFIVTRPQVISTLIMLLELIILERTFRDRLKRRLIILPILSILCVNLHSALWPMMVILILPFLIEVLLSRMNLKNSDSKINVSVIFLTIVGIILAGFINPYGWESMIFLFTSYDSSIHGHILEIAAPSADTLLGKSFIILAIILVVIYTKKTMPIRYSLLTFGLMFLAFMSIRSIFLFLIIATFPVAYAYKDWKSSLTSAASILSKPTAILPFFIIFAIIIYKIYIEKGINLNFIPLPDKIFSILMFLSLICFIFAYRFNGKLFSSNLQILCIKPFVALITLQLIAFGLIHSINQDEPVEPLKPAVDFLLNQDKSENIRLWTGFYEGGYVGFRGLRYYVDARPEVFAKSNNHKADIIKEYFDLRYGKIYYKDFFKRYDFTHILVTEDDMLLYWILEQDEDYELIFEDEFKRRGNKEHCRIFKPINR